MNMKTKTKTMKNNLIFYYTNKNNYTTRIQVVRITDKSVFYKSFDNTGKLSTYTFRMSKKSFEIYNPEMQL